MKIILIFFLSLLISCQFQQNTKKFDNHSEKKLIKKQKFDTIYKRFQADTLIEINRVFDASVIQDLNDEKEQNIVRFMYFCNNLDKNFDVFVQKSFASCRFLDSIGVKNDTITFFLNQKKFYAEKYVGDSTAWVYNFYFYHDIYFAFFNFKQFNTIRVFSVDENKSVENETLLPKVGEIELLIEGATMHRKWYQKQPKEWQKIFKNELNYLEDLHYESHFSMVKHSILDSLFFK